MGLTMSFRLINNEMKTSVWIIWLVIGIGFSQVEGFHIRRKRSSTQPRFVYPTSLTALKKAISHKRPFYVVDPAKGLPLGSQTEALTNSSSISITSIGQAVNKYAPDRVSSLRKVFIRKNPSDPSKDHNEVEAPLIDDSELAAANDPSQNDTNDVELTLIKEVKESSPEGSPESSPVELLKRQHLKDPDQKSDSTGIQSAPLEKSEKDSLKSDGADANPKEDAKDLGDPEIPHQVAPSIVEPIHTAPSIAVHISSSEKQYGALGSEYSRMLDPIDPIDPLLFGTEHQISDHYDRADDAVPGTSDVITSNNDAVSYDAPSYGAPVYEAPSYGGPEYSGPVFEAPSNGSTTIILVLNNDFSSLNGTRDLQVGPFYFHFVRGNSGKIGLGTTNPEKSAQ